MNCENRWRKSMRCLAVLFVTLALTANFAAAWQSAPLVNSSDADATLTLTPAGAFQINNDAALRRLLKEALSRLKEGQVAEGLTRLQTIFDRGDDAFVKLESNGPRREVRLTAQQTLGALGQADRDVYEKLFGSPAKQLFARSKQSGRAIYAAETVRKYFHTFAGGEAAKWLAARWLERGDAKPAIRLWERLLADSVHRQSLHLTNHLQVAAAQQLLGQESSAQELLERSGTLKLEVGGESRTAAQWTALLNTLPRRANDIFDGEWRAASGGANRNINATGSTPWLKPMWSVPLSVSHTDLSPVEHWRKSQEGENPAQWVVASEPLVVLEQVIVRDFSGISAFDLRTGSRLWRYTAAMSLSDVVAAADAPSQGSDVANAVHAAIIGNPAWGTLSSDGRSVFAVDYVAALDNANAADGRKPAEADTEQAPLGDLPRLLTRLIALPIGSSREASLNKNSKQPTWSLDGTTAGAKLAGPGHAVQFLGSPTVVDGCLYVIGELFSMTSFDTQKVGQLSLFAVDAESGEMLWSQGLALVEQPFFRLTEDERRRAVGSPSAADGMLVCPTDVGLIVGVDLVTGRQRWIYDVRMAESESQRRQSTENNFGWDGLPAWPVIHQGRVLLLPRSSEHLHCVDLMTGRLLWKVPRGDAVCIGAVTDDVIVLVGTREVRAISLTNQSTVNSVPPLWSRRLGLITGRGVRLGDRFLLPLKTGRVADLDLTTGLERGFSLRRIGDETDSPMSASVTTETRTSWPGNLIVSGDVVLSLGLTELTAYPQAQATLASLPKKSSSVEQSLQRSELAMLLGNDDSRVADLEDVLRLSLTPKLREQAERQLRESLYLELDRTPQKGASLLMQLSQLARTPFEEARLLRRQCEFYLSEDPARAMQLARRLAELAPNQELEMDELGEFVLSNETWAGGISRRIKASVERTPEEADRVLDVLDHERDSLRNSHDLTTLRRFVRVYDNWPQAITIRFQLANLLIEQGDFQEAELLLLRDRRNANPQISASATARLLNLWSRLSLHSLAGGLMNELADRFANVEFAAAVPSPLDKTKPVEKTLTGREFVAAFPRDSLTWAAFARRQRPAWEVRRVSISEDRASGGQLKLIEAYDQTGRRYTIHSGAAMQLFQKPVVFGSKDELGCQVVDKESGVVVGEIANMDRVFYPVGQPTPANTEMCHFLPLGGAGHFRGVSLLELDSRGELWNQPFAPLRVTEDFPRFGPFGPGFCVFQTRQHLVVLNPADGRVLWRRSNLEPQAGLFAENEWGLFGDREALVMFSQDYLSYVVYETMTGRELRRGKLNADLHQNRRVFGRKLFFLSDDRRVRVWDPLTDRLDLDEAIVDSSARALTSLPLVSATPDGDLLLVLPSGRIRVIDLQAGLLKLDVNLPPEFLLGVNNTKVFSDDERYFINLQRGMGELHRNQFNYHVPDLWLPKSDMQGEVYAFARPLVPQLLTSKSVPLGHRLWSRVIPQRSILRSEQTRLPFLIALSRQQNRDDNMKSSIRVEALDAATGDLIGALDHVVPDRFVQMEFDVPNSRITLKGLQTNVIVDYGRAKQSLVTTDETH